MFKKFIISSLFTMLALFTVVGCSTSDDKGADSGAIVEDPLSAGGDKMEDGAVVVGDDYNSPNSNVHLTAEQQAKLDALKQDASVYFALNSEAIASNYVSLLQAHAEFLREVPAIKVIIEGHTDERGTPEYNIALGERRARSVAQYLINLGVSVDQISIVSYGEEKPAAFGHDESSWSKNRRAVLVY